MHYICFANSWLAEGSNPMVGATVAVAVAVAESLT